MSREDKMFWVAVLAMFLFILGMMFANGQPAPPKPRKVLASPKGAELAASLAKVAAPAAIIVVPPAMKVLAWDWTPDTNNPASNVVFILRQSQDLTVSPTNWPVLAVTATNRWPITLSNRMMFYRCWSSNIVTHEVSL